MKNFKERILNSLIFRVVAPIIAILILLGVVLYFFLLRTVSDFAYERVSEKIEWVSHDIYDIVNDSLDELLKSGRSGDERAVRIKKGLAIGAIEDYLRNNGFKGFVYSNEMEKLVLGNDLEFWIFELVEKTTEEHKVQSLRIGKEKFYAYHFHFDPWKWSIVLLKDPAAYSGLIGEVRRIYLIIASVLTFAGFLLIFYFRSSIKGATERIIVPIKKGEMPQYKGINEFKFLSDNVRLMMGSLRESEAKNRALVDGIPDLMFRISGSGNFLDYKPSKSFDFAVSTRELTGKNIVDVLPEDVAEQSMACIAKALETGETQVLEYQLSVNGIMRDYEARFVVSGKDETLAIVREITEQKRAIEALVAAEEKFRSLVELSIVGIYIIQDGMFPYVNPILAETLGHTQEEIISSKTVMDFVLEEDRAVVLENLRKRIDGETISMRYSFRIRRKDGALREVEVHDSRTEYNGRPAVIGTLLDMTERKTAEALLRDSEEKYRRLFMESKDTVYITTPEGKFADINPAGEALFGYESREELMKVDIARDLYVDPRDRDRFQRAIEEQGYVKDYEIGLRRKDGEKINVLVTANAVYGDDDRVIAYRGMMRDITEQKELEQQLLQAQKMEAVGRLAGGIAHDINNYLSAVTGFCDIVKIKHSYSEEIVEKMDAATESIFKASALIKQLLAFSRKQPVRPIVVQLNGVVENMEEMMKRIIGEDVALETHLCKDLWNVRIDPSQVEQVIVNLLVNSRDAMPQGGNITIKTANVEAGKEFQKSHPKQAPGRYIGLTISDTGIGIPKKIHDKIFEPFFTTKGRDKGSGLGLATVYGIVKQNNGYVWVHSEAGKGATFEIYLPICEEKVSEHIDTLCEVVSKIEGLGRILIAEDNHDVRESMKAMLEALGYTVRAASNGDEALAFFDEMGGNIDLLITDVVMPGLSGKDVADTIKGRNEDVKVLFISGYDDSVIVDNYVLDESVNLLLKPFPARELAKKIKNILM